MKLSLFTTLAVLCSAVNSLSIVQVTPLAGTVGDWAAKQTVVAKLDRGESGFNFETASLFIDYKCLGDFMKPFDRSSGYPCAFCDVEFDDSLVNCATKRSGCVSRTSGTSLAKTSYCSGSTYHCFLIRAISQY